MDALRVVAIVMAVIVVVVLAAVGFMMWKYRIPPRGLIAMGGALIYLVSPIDVLPEALLGPIGLIDDAGVLAVAVSYLIRLATVKKMLDESGVDLSNRRGGPKDQIRRGGLGNDPAHPVIATEDGPSGQTATVADPSTRPVRRSQPS